MTATYIDPVIINECWTITVILQFFFQLFALRDKGRNLNVSSLILFIVTVIRDDYDFYCVVKHIFTLQRYRFYTQIFEKLGSVILVKKTLLNTICMFYNVEST